MQSVTPHIVSTVAPETVCALERLSPPGNEFSALNVRRAMRAASCIAMTSCPAHHEEGCCCVSSSLWLQPKESQIHRLSTWAVKSRAGSTMACLPWTHFGSILLSHGLFMGSQHGMMRMLCLPVRISRRTV